MSDDRGYRTGGSVARIEVGDVSDGVLVVGEGPESVVEVIAGEELVYCVAVEVGADGVAGVAECQGVLLSCESGRM